MAATSQKKELVCMSCGASEEDIANANGVPLKQYGGKYYCAVCAPKK